KALRDLEAGSHWALSGARGERAAGNGAAMRIAPLALVLDPDQPAQRQTLRDVCRITHHNDEAWAGALAVTCAVRFAIRPGYDFAALLTDVADRLPDSRVRDRLRALSALDGSITPRQAGERWGRSGFVAESVPLALLAAREIGHLPFA